MKNNDQTNKKSAVNEVALWISIGIVLGIGGGAALDNIGLGIVIGIAFGTAIGALRSRRKE